MENYDFLLAINDDIPEIMNVYHGLVGTPGCTWNMDYPNKDTAQSDIDCGALYVLKDNGKVIAVASAGMPDELEHMQWKPKRPCELSRIGVISSLQKRGIGNYMLQKVIAAVKEKEYDGIVMLVSKTNTAALALYDKNGFEQCGEAFMFGIDFYCYQMQFNPAV
jgi:ribosomal protein S18 acetylase RimI-like enzyme